MALLNLEYGAHETVVVPMGSMLNVTKPRLNES